MVRIPKETSCSEFDSENSSELLTPYQGNKRCFGQFRCDECNRSWFSANSWANTAQMCQLCDIRVYPFKQWPLKRGGSKKSNRKKAHPQGLCDKCKQLGHFCGQYNKSDESKKSKKSKNN